MRWASFCSSSRASTASRSPQKEFIFQKARKCCERAREQIPSSTTRTHVISHHYTSGVMLRWPNLNIFLPLPDAAAKGATLERELLAMGLCGWHLSGAPIIDAGPYFSARQGVHESSISVITRTDCTYNLQEIFCIERLIQKNIFKYVTLFHAILIK